MSVNKERDQGLFTTGAVTQADQFN
jgi:hypothetical protein